MDSKQEASLFSQILLDNLKNEGKNFSPRFGDRLPTVTIPYAALLCLIGFVLFICSATRCKIGNNARQLNSVWTGCEFLLGVIKNLGFCFQQSQHFDLVWTGPECVSTHGTSSRRRHNETTQPMKVTYIHQMVKFTAKFQPADNHEETKQE